ncbi:hypothetical protein SAMN06265222_1174 [Neorhodopirellula lusitana]|uniref:Uncharacterized protein n=1 Tax=Neorhodopirellula lusitana TaxID=445327 RepID=A0ABY1QNL1_9BACT|nr:hypothetical protein [Neorhodopirellula lusitana]SMP73764.1 hypothetical protein SAMN06265222_1174 [Neorhodopirellula lusitana]
MTIARRWWTPLSLLVIGVLSHPANVASQGPDAPKATDTTNQAIVLQVGTRESLLFAIKSADGSCSAISIEQWDHLADELNREFKFRELTLPEVVSGSEDGKLQAADATIRVTSGELDRLEFRHLHFRTGLSKSSTETRRTLTRTTRH